MRLGWSAVSLGEVCRISGDVVDPTALPEATPYIGLEHIEKGGRLIGTSSIGAAGVTSAKVRFTPSHVLFGKLRPNLGKVTIADVTGVASTDILPLLPSDLLDQRYLLHHLRRQVVLEEVARRATGANLPRISPRTLATIAVPLPPLEEQRRIATLLDHVDAIRRKRSAVIGNYRTLEMSLFAATKSSGMRRTLKELGVDFVAGKSVAGVGSDADEDRRVIKTSAVSSGSFLAGESKPLPRSHIPDASHRINPGDLLITRASGSVDLIGVTAIVPPEIPELYLPDKVWRVRVRDKESISIRYLHTVFKTPEFLAYIRNAASGASGVSNVSKAKFLNFSFRALGIAAQQGFATQAVRIDRIRDAAELHLAELDNLFDSLESRAFAGELDVSKVVLPA